MTRDDVAGKLDGNFPSTFRQLSAGPPVATAHTGNLTESFRRAPGPRPVAFARGAPKAAPRAGGGGGGVAGVIGAIVGSGGCGNGMQNGKRGFQPGNKCAAARNPHVTAAQKAHTAANAITRKHVKAGTLNTPAGRNAVRAAAKAARELRSARETHQAAQKVKYAENAKARRAAAKATAAKPEAQAAAQLQAAHATSVAARATAKPAEKAPAKPPAKPQPSPREQVVAASKEAMSIKAEKAATHLSDLHAGVKAGAIDAPTAHKHVDRIARGVTRDELFAAAKAHGIEHAATTKKALVDHLKAAHSAAAKPAEVARPPAPKVPEAARPKEAAPPKAEAARPAEAAARKLGPAAREIRSIGEDVAAGRLRPDQVRGRVADARRVHGDAAVARAATALGVAHVGGASAAHSLTRHIEGLAGKAATPRAETLPVKDFADRVVKAAHATPAGGFGDQKTMISHVKAHLEKTDPAFRGMSDADFKARLVEAHRARHLELGRADLREAMHPADLRASSTPHLGAEYHFIRHPEAPGKEQSRPAPAAKAPATVEGRLDELRRKFAAGKIKESTLDKHAGDIVRSEGRDRLARGLTAAGVRGVTEHHSYEAIRRRIVSHVKGDRP